MTKDYPTVTLDLLSHTYTIQETSGSRRTTHGVTSLLENVGLSSNEFCPEERRDFGTIAHEHVRLFLADDLGEYDSDFEPWMDGIRCFRKECEPEPIVLDDKPVYSQKYDYAGLQDFLGLVTPPRMPRDTYALDWKFWAATTPSKAVIDAAELQLMGYAIASLEMGLCKTLPKRAVVHFYPNGYRWYHFTDPSARPAFISVVNVNKWKKRKG